ncbi:MAG TPA: Gfo/Idh/MocA family oxidoreductase [Thermoanaerobaculia bacterium]|nr:Gfo/Idh/MocA family oxidoreductase [Thermoanaerobaculia bacterium]
MTIRTALVGCGRIADRHVRLVTSMPEFSLAAVADVHPGKAEALAAHFGGRAYLDYREMLEREKPDLVHVLTPSGSHAAIALDAMEVCENVLVEKPMALSLEDADAMIAKAERLGRRLFVVKQNRYNLPVVKLREALEQGRFGRLTVGAIRVRWCRRQDYYDQDDYRGTWGQDGGALTNQASHHIDMLQWMFGPVDEVFAMTARQLVRIEAEDTGVAVVRFASGALGTIEATTAARPTDIEASISVLGEHGIVEIGGFALNETKRWTFESAVEEDAEVLSAYRTNPPNVYGFGHHEYLAGVARTIASDGVPEIGGREGRKSLELIVAIYESAERNAPVKYPFTPQLCRLGK